MDPSALPRRVVRCLTKSEAADYRGIGVTMLEGLGIPAVPTLGVCFLARVNIRKVSYWARQCTELVSTCEHDLEKAFAPWR